MLRRLALTALALGAAGLAGAWVLTRPASLPPATLAALAAHPADAARGEAVFWAAGCASCHTAPDVPATAPVGERLVLAGGRRFATPFGTFTAPNVSMHPGAGIGGWTREQFATAVLLGVSPGGTHYFPAFPYAPYARATPQDVADLWAFWQTLPAAASPSQPHDLGFPFNQRRAVGFWKLLNLDTEFVTTAPADAQIARGRYLVEALGHCAECHTQGWSAEDIANYLQSGFTPSFDVVGGEMADVVANIGRIAPEDRAAIAAYLVALRSSPSR